MTASELRRLARVLRDYIGDVEHHIGCDARQGKPCDCYAKKRWQAAEALDQILDAAYERLRESAN
jgi:hypothetical protein